MRCRDVILRTQSDSHEVECGRVALDDHIARPIDHATRDRVGAPVDVRQLEHAIDRLDFGAVAVEHQKQAMVGAQLRCNGNLDLDVARVVADRLVFRRRNDLELGVVPHIVRRRRRCGIRLGDGCRRRLVRIDRRDRDRLRRRLS